MNSTSMIDIKLYEVPIIDRIAKNVQGWESLPFFNVTNFEAGLSRCDVKFCKSLKRFIWKSCRLYHFRLKRRKFGENFQLLFRRSLRDSLKICTAVFKCELIVEILRFEEVKASCCECQRYVDLDYSWEGELLEWTKTVDARSL